MRWASEVDLVVAGEHDALLPLLSNAAAVPLLFRCSPQGKRSTYSTPYFDEVTLQWYRPPANVSALRPALHRAPHVGTGPPAVPKRASCYLCMYFNEWRHQRCAWRCPLPLSVGTVSVWH